MAYYGSSIDSREFAVLLVEDALEDALLIRGTVQDSLECRITLVQDGIRGCQLAEDERWDLVIVDLNLPGRSGVEVIRSSTEANPATPVLAVTAYQDRIDQATDAGADWVMRKPLEKRELRQTIRFLILSARASRGKKKFPLVERRVLALGGLPGDVEAGCGGILLGHSAYGQEITLVTMSAGGELEDVEARRLEAQRGAKLLGASVILPDWYQNTIPSQAEMNAFVSEVMARVRPHTLYSPSPSDVRESRYRVHRAAAAGGGSVPRHFAYQSCTTTLRFRPSLFIDIRGRLEKKLKLLSQYRSAPDFRPHLQPEIVKATSVYWGRFLGYSLAEPLEVVQKTPANGVR